MSGLVCVALTRGIKAVSIKNAIFVVVSLGNMPTFGTALFFFHTFGVSDLAVGSAIIMVAIIDFGFANLAVFHSTDFRTTLFVANIVVATIYSCISYSAIIHTFGALREDK